MPMIWRFWRTTRSCLARDVLKAVHAVLEFSMQSSSVALWYVVLWEPLYSTLLTDLYVQTYSGGM